MNPQNVCWIFPPVVHHPGQCLDRSGCSRLLAVVGVFSGLLRRRQSASGHGESGAPQIRAEMGKLDLDQTFTTRSE